MSSFKKNPNINLYRCVYCTKNFTPGSQQRCPQCHLWQPNTAATIVSQVSRFVPKQIRYIYIISLENDKERWRLFLRRLNNSFCKLENRQINRFIAVNGADANYVNIVLDNVYDNDKDKQRALSFYKKHPGSIGCYLSHLTLWQVLQQNASNERYVLIMEDDAYFVPYALQNLEIVLSQAERLKTDWDILYVGHNHLQGVKIHPLFLKPIPSERRKGYNTGFFGYVVNLSSIKKIIDIVKRFDTPFVDLSVRQNFGDKNDQISALFLNISLIQHNKKYTSSRRVLDQKFSNDH